MQDVSIDRKRRRQSFGAFRIPFEDDTNSMGSGFAAVGDPEARQPDVFDVTYEVTLVV